MNDLYVVCIVDLEMDHVGRVRHMFPRVEKVCYTEDTAKACVANMVETYKDDGYISTKLRLVTGVSLRKNIQVSKSRTILRRVTVFYQKVTMWDVKSANEGDGADGR